MFISLYMCQHIQDMLFGTHRLSSAPKSNRRDTSVEQEQADTDTNPTATGTPPVVSSPKTTERALPPPAKNSKAFLGLPLKQNATYDALNLIILGVFLSECVGISTSSATMTWSPVVVAWIVAVGPVVIGVLLGAFVFCTRQSLIWPFHNSPKSTLFLHWGLAAVLVLLPVYVPIRKLAEVVIAERRV
jgi:hypothetical protein